MNYRAYLPFLKWLPELKKKAVLKADILAGITVAMLIIPQGMACAKLAGIPIQYGLYAALLPPIIAALFGSSRILSTGPVAITSLLTAIALQGMAAPNTPVYISYVLLLALLIGLVQFFLGIFKGGIILNFISNPVLVGFTNGAALIIATLQLGSVFGINTVNQKHHYQILWQIIQQVPFYTHWPTVGFSCLTLVIIYSAKYFYPKFPPVILAVFICTFLSWFLQFEKVQTIEVRNIVNFPVQEIIKSYKHYPEDFKVLTHNISNAQKQLKLSLVKNGTIEDATARAVTKLSQAKWELERLIIQHKIEQQQIYKLRLQKIKKKNTTGWIVPAQITPLGEVSKTKWQISKVLNSQQIVINTGGKIVGFLPSGLPKFTIPSLDVDKIFQLILTAFVIALVGFTESTSIIRYLAPKTKDILNPNQELIGQGITKIIGSFFQAMATSGGFSRTVLNYEAGAKTNFSSVVTGLMVMLVLLGFTKLFYYLPLASLAMVVIISAIGLLNFKAMFDAWHVNKSEGLISAFTFFLTLLLAPQLALALLIGVLLSLGLYLNGSLHPSFHEMFISDDHEIADLGLTCRKISILRFWGSLYFANAAYFQNKLLQFISANTSKNIIIIDCTSINYIDASGVDTLKSLHASLEEAKIELWFTKLRAPLVKTLRDNNFQGIIYKKNNKALLDARANLTPKHLEKCEFCNAIAML